MQPTKATRWFGATLLGASAVQSRDVERPATVVTIEPSRIEVIGKRRSSVFDALADRLPRRGGAS